MSRTAIFLLLFCCSVTAGVCQRDRRIEAIPPELKDTTLVNSLIGQSDKLRESNPLMAREYCFTALRTAKQLKYRKGEGRALGSLAWVYYTIDDYVNALENAYEALKIAELINDKAEMARSENNIGVLDYHQRKYEDAMVRFRRGLSLASEVHDDVIVARSLNNIAAMFHQLLPSSDSARIYADRSLVLSNKAGDNYRISIANYTLGELDFTEKKYPEALTHFKIAVELQTSETMKISLWNSIVTVYLKQGKVQETLPILAKNLSIATKHHYRQQLATTYYLLARVNKRLEKYKLALDYHEQYVSLKDSIYTNEVSSRLAAAQAQADLDIKQAQIELLTKDTMINKDKMTRQSTQLYTMIGGFIGILFLTGVLVFSYQKIERTNILLKQRTAELARINATKDKLFSIISHDFRSPLNSLKGLLSLLENKNLSREEFIMLAEKLSKNLNAVSNDLENLLQWSVAQLQGINTHAVKIDIHPIVEEHVVVFHEQAKAKNVTMVNRIKKGLYGVADEDHIRLVLRNLINNAIKFTPPGGTVEISGETENSFIRIQVADTGVGIASEQMESLFHKDRSISTKGTNQEKGVGIGLLLCAEFVETNGGQLNVESAPGKGSVFSFTLRAPSTELAVA